METSSALELENGLFQATVQGGFGQEFMVLTGHGHRRATVALSCLVQPQEGDQVLIQINKNKAYILSILSRNETQDVTLNFPASVKFLATNGQCHFTSKKPMLFSSCDEISMLSYKLNLASTEMMVTTEQATVHGRKLNSFWQEVHSVADFFNLISQTAHQTIKNLFSKIEGTEQRKVGNSLQTVDNTLLIRSHHAVINAQSDIKIDGERIHMG